MWGVLEGHYVGCYAGLYMWRYAKLYVEALSRTLK
jgi:hypothetical protein